MKVTITVDNGDQEVEITRSRTDIMSLGYGRISPGAGLAAVLDLAVADVRRACDLDPSFGGEGVCGDRLPFGEWPDSVPHPGGCALRYGHDSPVHEAEDHTRWQRSEDGGLFVDGSAVQRQYVPGTGTG